MVPKVAEFGIITQNNDHYVVQVIQGHQFGYQWTAHMRLFVGEHQQQ